MVSNSLDGLKGIEKYDPQDMLGLIHDMPEQCRQAWAEAGRFRLPREYSKVDKVIVLGMGGSAIGGDLVRSLALNESQKVVFVQRDYTLPSFVDDRTLVVASSYSGETEETISAFEQSLKTGAKKLVMTTGGKIKEIAESNNIPVFEIKFKSQPRAALGYSFLPLLNFFQKLGFVENKMMTWRNDRSIA